MPVRMNEEVKGAPYPKTPHLGLLTNLKPPWVQIHPGNWMAYGPGKTEPTPMVLVAVKAGKYGVEMEFACCANPKCTKRIKFAGKWNGRHIEMGKDEDVKGE